MDYQKSYLNLSSAVTDAISAMTDVQCYDEENFFKLYSVKEKLISAQINSEKYLCK